MRWWISRERRRGRRRLGEQRYGRFVPSLQRSRVVGAGSPAVTGWAELWRASGADGEARTASCAPTKGLAMKLGWLAFVWFGLGLAGFVVRR